MPPLTKMKDAISLADKANQELNQFRRNMIKPYLPPQFIKLADISDDSTNFLFGDSIADTVESLRKANQIKLLKDNTLKVNRRRQTIKPLQSPRTGIQTTAKTKVFQIKQQQKIHKKQHHQSCQKSTHQHISMLQEGQQAPQKEILIPFRQALQA